MTWEITWALILGFALSAVIQAVVRREVVVRLLGDARPRTLVVAAGLGAASSSCSYAAVALARALFRRGADFTAAMAFEIASTNLVIELGVILALLMGWQFTLAEFTGGPLMIVVLAVLFRIFLRDRLLSQARDQAGRGLAGSMEGHAAMDMSIRGEGTFARRLFSREGFTSVSHVFVMEWAAIIRDLVIGLLAAGAIAAWVPDSFWRAFFFAGHGLNGQCPRQTARSAWRAEPGGSHDISTFTGICRSVRAAVFVEDFFLAEDERPGRTRSFQDLLARPGGYPGRVSAMAARALM